MSRGRKKRTVVRSEFKQWLAIPKRKREKVTGLGTQTQFADHFNVNNSTLSNWKSEPGFMNDVERKRRKHLDEELSGIYDSLIERAKEGDTQAIKMAFQQSGRWQEDLSEDDEVPSEEDAAQMTDEDLAETFAELISGGSGVDQETLQVMILNALGKEIPQELRPEEGQEEGLESQEVQEDFQEELGEVVKESEPSEEPQEDASQEQEPTPEEEDLEDALTDDLTEDEFDPSVQEDSEDEDLETTDEFTIPDTW